MESYDVFLMVSSSFQFFSLEKFRLFEEHNKY
jgi:hypothetical protein